MSVSKTVAGGRGSWPRACWPSVWARPRPGRRRRPRSRPRSTRALREVQGPQGRQERGLHPGPGQGRFEHLRHRPRDHGRQGLHRGRRQVARSRSSRSPRSSRWPRSSRSRARRRSRRRSAWTRRACASTRSSRSSSPRRSLGGPEMNSLVNPGAIATTSMVKGATPRRDLEEHPRLLLRLRRPAADRGPGGLQVGGGHQPAQPGHRLPDVRLRLHQGRTRCRPRTSTPSSAR